ncbi:MAG: bifunctional phosphopantothenoylcysteine decarboxylase/phosphopantothenate--cysteine ligase CoaBC [Nitrospirales bacterium]|nr:bifunctional phosphopantothenoylcysteine decarboxylase/phosphopantothenate--cysteine ligase CoaBC [Nitrospirales bacterium]
MSASLIGKRIVLGVTGSIAAYKAVALLRLLVQAGAEVQVVLTESASRFIAPLTFEVLSGHPVVQDLFAGHQDMKHLSVTEQADLLLVTPCTANTLAKLALGLADNLLGTVALTIQCPLIICPAMDGEMWEHPTVQGHVTGLRGRGVMILEPETGALASGQWGKGRLPDEAVIFEEVCNVLVKGRDLQHERLLISAGPTQEPLDPIRFLSNGSTGKMGYALAEAAIARGAEVVLVSGPTQLKVPRGVSLFPVQTAEDMLRALTAHFHWATTLIMTAAVGDFRPKQALSQKLKKEQWDGAALQLERTPDILLALSAQRTHQRMIGFAAETDHLLEHGQAKLAQKHLDMLVVNQIGGNQSAFGNNTNEVHVLTPHNPPRFMPRQTKRQLAGKILDCMLDLPPVHLAQPTVLHKSHTG